VPDGGLDAEKLGILRRWGTGLQADAREEVAAAGRAITLLIEEVERLHVQLWDKRLFPDSPFTVSSDAPEPVEEPVAQPRRRPSLGGFGDRLRRSARETFPQADPQAEPPSETQIPDALQQDTGEDDESAAGSPFPV
jgi:hypothetical protein